MRAKLGDLGATRFTDGSLSVGPMSPLYVAPERLAGRTLPNSKEADVYSMGVSLVELFTGDQMDQEDRPRQLRSVRQRDLRLVCVKMACENVGERMMASVALTVNDISSVALYWLFYSWSVRSMNLIICECLM